jgi:serine O-acetyltransferase
MDASFLHKLYERHQHCPHCPSPKRVTAFFEDLLGTLFPEFSDDPFHAFEDFQEHVDQLQDELNGLLHFCVMNDKTAPKRIAQQFFDQLPAIHDLLEKDVVALEKGDPAAKSQQEVIRTYPGFYATAAHRFAHALHLLKVPIIPRMLSEHAHSHTGIDIHPGATIGKYFCIDHGTGIVIGETSVIGDHVKMYQGVTLGALSVRKEDASLKRHPTIEDFVVLYAGATILGGDTVIGHHSVVGGNVWITRSIEPNSKVYYQAKMNDGKNEDLDLFIYKTEK